MLQAVRAESIEARATRNKIIDLAPISLTPS